MKKIISLFLLLFIFAVNFSYADIHPTDPNLPTYRLILKNDVQVTPKIYKFEIWISSVSSNVQLNLRQWQAGISYNTAILNGGTITATLDYTGSILLQFSDMYPQSINTATAGAIKIAAKLGAMTSYINIPNNGTEYKLVTVTMTNTNNFAQAKANLGWLFSSTPYPTKVFAYISSSLPNAQLTMPNNAPGTVIQSWHYTDQLTNPTLNAPTGPTAQNVTGGGSYCEGTTPTGVSVGLAGSETGYDYQLYKDAVAYGTALAGTGNPLTWNNLPAGVYTVKSGTTDMNGSATVTEIPLPVAPTVDVVNACGQSTLTASNYTGALLWSTNETTGSIVVNQAGNYTVTQTVNGCTSLPGSGNAAPIAIPAAPQVSVMDNCGNSELTASNYTGTLLWSTNETTASIVVTQAGNYTVTQTVNGCTSLPGSGNAAPIAIPNAPTVTVIDGCGQSTLTASNYTGTLTWSTLETTPSINVTVASEFSVYQTVGGCNSALAYGETAPIAVPSAPTVNVVDACGQSTLTASNYTGTLLWSTNETTASIVVTQAGNYTVTQTLNGCTSAAASGNAAPIAIPAAPTVNVVDACGQSTLTASNYTGTLLWSTNETTASIVVTQAGNYTVTQTVNGCTSAAASGNAAPIAYPSAPTVDVVNACGQSTLTASNYTGTLLWSTNETTASIVVTQAGNYTVTQTVNGCESAPATGIAAPNAVPAAPTVDVVDACGQSTLTASNYTGTLLWSTNETTASIVVTQAGNYTVTQTVNGCTSLPGSGNAAPLQIFNQTVTIQASANPSVIGNPVTYTASAVPAASNQIFDWYINNVWQNTNGDNTFTYTPVNGDIITCSAVPVGCYTGGNSNSITQIVGPAGPVTNTWLGGNNDWHQASNWSQGIVPMNNHNVVIPIVAMWYPIINQPAVCNNLTIESGAQLINNSTLAIGGTVKVKQALTSGQWHFISSPINNATAYSFSLANPNNIGQTLYLQKYNEAWEMLPGNSPWVDITTGWQEVMSAGKGYEVWSDNNHTVVFEGTILNKDNVSAPVNYTPTATFPGYNLIGNPYPSGLDIHGFNTWGNNMDASIWVWDGSQYLFQNSMFGNLGWYIAPKQAFMVKANNVAPSFVIPATAKSFSGTFLKSTVADLLKLQVNGNNYSDAAYINFNSNATNDYDGQFDVEKLFGIEAAPQLYSTITGKNLSINTLPSLNGNVVVPMSLKVGANGTYTINASEMNSFASGTSIYLEDLKTGSFTNLKQQPVYTFTANVSDNSDRFRIHFAAPNGIAENGNGNIRIYSNDNVIYVNNLANENIKEIVVMNVLGQQLLSKQSVNRTLNTITMDVASAYYVVKVVTENKVYTQKVYVR